MSEAPVLRGYYKRFTIPSDTFMPRVWLSIVDGVWESQRLETLMDTGSAAIIIPKSYALTMLPIKEEEIPNGAPSALAGTGGGTDELFGFKRNVNLRANLSDKKVMLLEDVWVWVSQKPLLPKIMFSGLFGQRSGFHERSFEHHNHPKKRYWELRNI